MHKFKVGDWVRFHPRTRNYGASKGALGICLGFEQDYINIEWIRNKDAGEQNNGLYSILDFEPVKKELKIIKPYGIVKFLEGIK